MNEEWQEYWTPEEYAHMREILSPDALAEELRMRRENAQDLQAAREMGFSDEEALTMMVRAETAGYYLRNQAENADEVPPWETS